MPTKNEITTVVWYDQWWNATYEFVGGFLMIKNVPLAAPSPLSKSNLSCGTTTGPGGKALSNHPKKNTACRAKKMKTIMIWPRGGHYTRSVVRRGAQGKGKGLKELKKKIRKEGQNSLGLKDWQEARSKAMEEAIQRQVLAAWLVSVLWRTRWDGSKRELAAPSRGLQERGQRLYRLSMNGGSGSAAHWSSFRNPEFGRNI